MIGIALLLALVVVAFGIGAFYLRKLTELRPLERVVFGVPLGMGTLSYTFLVVGLLGGAKAVPLTGAMLVIGLPLAFLGYRSLPKRTKGEEQSAGVLGIAVALVLGLCALATLAGALNLPGAVQEWDSVSYHLAAPKRYLAEGRIYYIPDDHHSNFPFTLNMLYLWMLSLGSIAGAKLCHWLCGVLLTLAVYTAGERFFNKTVGQVAAVMIATTPMLLWESTTAYIDLALALFSFLSVYAALIPRPLLPTSLLRRASGGEGEPEGILPSPTEALRNEKTLGEGPGVRALLLSAALMGLALGTKTTALVFWGMGLIGVFVAYRAQALRWGTVSLALGLPWYIKTFLYTGDPVYPFGWKLFHGRYWSEPAATSYAQAQAAFGFGKDPLNLLVAPWNVTMEAGLISLQRPYIFTEYVNFGLSPVYLGLGLMLPLLVKRWEKPAVVLLVWAVGIAATWFFMMQQTRYLVPALPAFALVLAWALLQGGKVVKAGGGALIALAALWGSYLAITQLIAPAPLGIVEKAELWINENAPKDAKVALFDETRGFYLDRPYVWAQPNHAPGLLPYDSYADVDAFLADFKRRGYTYLLINTANSPTTPDDPQWDRWRALLRDAVSGDKVEMAQAFGKVVIYRIP